LFVFTHRQISQEWLLQGRKEETPVSGWFSILSTNSQPKKVHRPGLAAGSMREGEGVERVRRSTGFGESIGNTLGRCSHSLLRTSMPFGFIF
jgi:hypothetical protein